MGGGPKAEEEREEEVEPAYEDTLGGGKDERGAVDATDKWVDPVVQRHGKPHKDHQEQG